MNIDNLTATEILKISLDSPEELYVVKNEVELKKVYRKLSMKWHPDRQENKLDTSSVFAHLQVLYESALKKIGSGIWTNKNELIIKSDSGSEFELKYLKKEGFELGQKYIGSSYVMWIFEKENNDLAKRMLSFIKSFKYPNDNMKKEISKNLPIIKKEFLSDGKQVIILDKDKESINLKDLLIHFNNKIDPKHVAWILSCLYNLSCYLEYSKIMHGGISIENIFVNPSQHSLSLLGGWWYAHKDEEKLIALNKHAVNIAPPKLIDNKIADKVLNLEMIKLVGRELLGNKNGVYLLKDKSIPMPLIYWLRDASGNNAFKEYEFWQNNILKNSFGVRRFTKMEIQPSDIYS